ncbi:MAG: TspO/MBR family protein, partial [Pseudomonadota bacterium]
DWLFAPAWTVIFILTGYAAVDSYTHAPLGARWVVVIVFCINAVLNVLWSFCFFTLKSPMLALYEVVLLWLSIVTIMIVIAPFSPNGALALLAYLAWVSFAAFLNFTVVKLNGPGAT